MNIKTVAMVAWLFFQAPISAQSDISPRDLALAAASRAEALSSGIIEYVQHFAIRGKNVKSHIQFSFMGNSWAIRYLDSEKNTFISHKGKSIDLVGNIQRDNTTVFSSHISSPKEMDYVSPFPPFFAGSFWFRNTAKFVREHAGAAQYRGSKVIDGHQTHLLEWELQSPAILKAFHETTDVALFKGKLKVYVAPNLGFSLPLVEYTGETDKPACVFRATGFKQYAGGIYLPHECVRQDYNTKGPLTEKKYVITKYDSINEHISDDKFRVTLPMGTYVTDNRNGSSFVVGDRIRPAESDMSEIINNFRGGLLPAWAVWILSISGGCIVGLFTVYLYFVWKRRRLST